MIKSIEHQYNSKINKLIKNKKIDQRRYEDIVSLMMIQQNNLLSFIQQYDNENSVVVNQEKS